MEVIGAISASLDIFAQLYYFIKSLFWKNKNILYINSNKKVFDEKPIGRCLPKDIDIDDYKNITVNSDLKIGFKNAKAHFLRMKKSLFEISQNLKRDPKIIYGGYVSVPFAVFDGYCLGDNHEYELVYTSKNNMDMYSAKFTKERKTAKQHFDIKKHEKVVNLLIPSSYPISHDAVSTNEPIFEFPNTAEDLIEDDYLNSLFYFISDFLDECREKCVGCINLYIAAKQPVSFVTGTAIQAHHPLVNVFEFENGKYTWNLEVQNGKIIEESK
jgi:hypothetical protein